jgi:triacylglycerol lipase
MVAVTTSPFPSRCSKGYRAAGPVGGGDVACGHDLAATSSVSPVRRRALIGMLAVAVVLVLVVVVVARVRGRTPVSLVPQDRQGPVLLVPGYGGSTVSLQTLATALRAQGRAVTVVDLVGDGTGDLRVEAQQVARAADAALAGGAPSVDVVGYSAGGVVARIWAADLGGTRQARRIVTLGSPHHGTDVAQLGAVLVPGACPVACQQLAPGSDLLAGLDDTPDGPVWTSLWTTVDDTVTPPDSARLDGALDVPVQDVCPDSRVTHGNLPRDPLVIGLVSQALAVAPLTAAPSSAQCARVRALGSLTP